jgi:hypothetical protein
VRRKVVSDSDEYEDDGADDNEEVDDDIIAGMFSVINEFSVRACLMLNMFCRHERG